MKKSTYAITGAAILVLFASVFAAPRLIFTEKSIASNNPIAPGCSRCIDRAEAGKLAHGNPEKSENIDAPPVSLENSGPAKQNILEEDPFATSETIREKALATGELKSEVSVTISTVKLRGFIRVKNRPALAMIEIGDRANIYLVRRGDTIVSEKGASPVVMKIIEVSGHGIVIEIVGLDQTIEVK